MTAECVFGDWVFNVGAAPLCAFRAGGQFPLRWDGAKVREVILSEGLWETTPWVALAAHWAQEHRMILEVMVGPVELDVFPRTGQPL